MTDVWSLEDRNGDEFAGIVPSNAGTNEEIYAENEINPGHPNFAING